MRESLLPLLRCPACGQDGRWDVRDTRRDDREIRQGRLCCQRCGAARAVTHGVADLMHDAPEFVVREAQGLGRFADVMRADGWDREQILRLPDVPLGYWYHQKTGLRQTLESAETRPSIVPGRRILDVGANTCWASAALAGRGLDVVALDIAMHEMQGLRTADWWLDAQQIYFERVLGVMFALPFADESFDLVFCCEVLHHNDRANLIRTMGEIARVLKPGGKVIVVNEPVRALASPKLRPGADVAEFEGHEHAYVRATYVRAARRAGLDTQILPPWTIGAFSQDTWALARDTPVAMGFRMAAFHAVRAQPLLRRAYLWWRTYVSGTSLSMVASKPGCVTAQRSCRGRWPSSRSAA
ncbi:MAG: type 11 methyltransferase [Solirubrobacterales bacterium]|nr:type 11 methyltransferase [Solirubrobacterales bacterium]